MAGSILTVNMPEIGEGVVEGEVIEWLKKEGDAVGRDEPVVVLMTDKATVELPAPQAGVLVKQYYKVGEIALRDKPLYALQIAGSSAPEQKVEEKKESVEPKAPSKIEKPFVATGTVLATPDVRRRARELNIPLEQVQGTGKEGRISEQDLAKFAQGPSSISFKPLSLPGDESIPLVGIPGQMAKSMQLSQAEVPPFSWFEQADVTRLIQLREKILPEALKEGIRLSFMPFLIRALSHTLREFPKINSSFDREKKAVIVHTPHNIGIAFSSSGGLFVPVLKNVQSLTLEQIIRSYEELKQKAVQGKLSPNDMQEATISLSNFGASGSGALWATPIINPPQVAILAVAKIQKQPAVRAGAIVPLDLLNLSWSFDHRVIDGDLAAHVSHFFANLLQNPTNLL